MLTLILCPFHPPPPPATHPHPRVTAVAPKETCHSTKSAGGRLHLNMHTPLTQGARHSVGGNLSGNELTRNSSGNTRSQSSQLVEPLWTDPGLKSGISVRELISTYKKTKQKAKRKAGGGMNCQAFSPNPRMRGKIHHHHHHVSGTSRFFPAYSP